MPPTVPTDSFDEMSATRAHIGDILKPKQKILMLIITIEIVKLSINGSMIIDSPATAQPNIIGTKRDLITFVFAEINISEIIPPSITEAKASTNVAEAANPI